MEEATPLQSSRPGRNMTAQSMNKTKQLGRVEWTRCYQLCCMCVALLVGMSPLLGLTAYEGWHWLSVGSTKDGVCDGRIHALDGLGINGSTEHGRRFALATYTDDGPRGEYRRMARLALSNKRAYAMQHGYSLYVFTSSHPECLRQSSASLKSLVLQELVQRRTYDWLFWLDPDALIVEQSLSLSMITSMPSHGVGGGGGIPVDSPVGKPQAQMIVSENMEHELSLGVMLLDGRSKWSACLLSHAASIHRCVTRGMGSDVPGLWSLLRPRTEHEYACIRQHQPHACDGAAVGAAASNLQDGEAERRSHGAPQPAHETLTTNYMLGVRVLPRAVLNGEPGSFHEGDFVVRISGCIVDRRGRSLRWCEAAFSRFQNLSRSRSREARNAS